MTTSLEILENLGPALRFLRDKAGITQEELAERALLTRAQISSYETGRRTPFASSLFKYLEGLDSDLVALQMTVEILKDEADA